MNKIELYLKNNHLQRAGAKDVLNRFKHMFKWRSDGFDSILDVGCGPCDTTIDILLPILPKNFSRLLGIDLSEEMIEYNRKTHIHPKVSFEQFNLEIELEKQTLNGIEPFDHITSFFCLHWVSNQKCSVQSMYKLLKPGGDMLVAFISDHIVTTINKELAKSNRWAQYMGDVGQRIPPFHDAIDPAGEYRNVLRDCGFKDIDVHLCDMEYIFDNADHLKDLIHATSRFIDFIPTGEKEAFLDEFISLLVQNGCAVGDFQKNPKCQFKLPYKLIVAYARK